MPFKLTHFFAPAVAIAAPAPVFAVDYLTYEQAQAALFPEADRFDVRHLTLDEPVRAKLQETLRLPVRARWLVRVARKGEALLGAAIVDDVVGRFELITFAAGVGADGLLRQVEILSYRESHGQEVRQASWRSQFAGKAETAPLKVGDDISNISGATLSCTHLADGARRSVAVLAELRKAGALK